jgi:uncharacterized membrane protein
MKEQLGRILKYLIDSVESTGNFVLQQAPDVVQQYVLYQRCLKTLFVVLSIVAFLAAIGCLLSLRKYLKRVTKNWELKAENTAAFESVAPRLGAATVFVGFGIGLFANNIQECILAWVAPKVLILEYVANLLK